MNARCFDTALLDRFQGEIDAADEREFALEALTTQSTDELISEFRACFAGTAKTIRQAQSRGFGQTAVVTEREFCDALSDALLDMDVFALLVEATAARTPEALEAFMAAAAQRYADDNASDLAEIEIDGSTR